MTPSKVRVGIAINIITNTIYIMSVAANHTNTRQKLIKMPVKVNENYQKPLILR